MPTTPPLRPPGEESPAGVLRVLALTAYPDSAASARVRLTNFAPFLSSEGVELGFRPSIDPDGYAVLTSPVQPATKALVLARSIARAAAARDRAALILIHRLLLLTPVPWLDPPRRLDVYDFDDALLVGSAAESNRRFQWVKQEARRTALCMRRAELVIAANPTLATQARQHATRVEVVPSCVDPSTQPLRSHEDRETLTLGWIGSHTTVHYLKPVLPAIAKLNERDRAVRLVVIGGDTGIRADWIEHRPWSLSTQVAELAAFDIGLMPLPQTEWAQGKSGYKLLQYFAAGVPAVASPVGVNANFVSGGRGIAATTGSEWEAAIVELMSDASSRRQRGALARQFVERDYSYQRWAPELAALLRSARSS